MRVLTEFDENELIIRYTRFEVIFCENKYAFFILNFITEHTRWYS